MNHLRAALEEPALDSALCEATILRLAQAQLGEAGARLDARGMRNPSWCPWQLHLSKALTLVEPARAVELSLDAVCRARQFGTASGIGQLHAAAQVRQGPERLKLLAEAVSYLERSPSGYDLAVALVDEGASLRRTERSEEAADRLYRGLEGAVQCGADGLAARARDELSAAGLRPLKLRVDQAGTLTSQERAVAERAARGWTDRRIIEELGIEADLVARLLSGVFRKLGTDRAGLARLLGIDEGRPQEPASGSRRPLTGARSGPRTMSACRSSAAAAQPRPPGRTSTSWPWTRATGPATSARVCCPRRTAAARASSCATTCSAAAAPR